MTGRRTLVVEVENLLIEDGTLRPPRVGAVIELPLRFGHTPAMSEGAVTVRAVVEPASTPPRRQYAGVDRPRSWQWQGLLRGDGWTASWRGVRPLTGPVELTGRFRAVLGDDRGRARGRVTRVQIVTERFHCGPHTREWVVVPGHRRVRDVPVAPRFFDRGAMDDSSGGVTEHDVGVLVTLDLDDVPALPPRPRIVPGAISAAGQLLWVLDGELPVLVSIDPARRVREYLVPGAVGADRRIWATPRGCWVTGAEGVFHCGFDTAVTRVDDRPVAGAALLGEGGLVARCSGVWILYRRDEDPVEIAVPDGVVLAWGGDRSGVLALISGEEGRRLVRVGADLTVTVGPVRPDLPDAHRRFLAATPLRVLADRRVARVQPDLTLGPLRRLPKDFLTAGQVGPYVWGVHHPTAEINRNGGLLPVANLDFESYRQFWMFTLLNSDSFEEVSTTPIFTTWPSPTIDAAGTVWILADGLRSIPTVSMAWPPLLDVAALLEAAVPLRE